MSSVGLPKEEMRPEGRQQAADDGQQEPSSDEATADGKDTNLLSEEEKMVFDLLKENSPADLNELKEQTGLSNKKWDKAIKELRKQNLAKVEKTDEGLFVSLV